MDKLYYSATQNLPDNQLKCLYPIPDKHLINTSLDCIHTTRRAQVLSQKVEEKLSPDEVALVKSHILTRPERVFQRSNPKPLETTTTFPDSLINSENNFDTFLAKDRQKALVFRNFKNLNRELTKAYLRQQDMQKMFSKAKGGALPEQ